MVGGVDDVDDLSGVGGEDLVGVDGRGNGCGE